MGLKLSVITINFNNASGLKRTIDSVASQSFRDFEFLIVDGGSTDGSVKVIEEFDNLNNECENDRSIRLTWISESDNGIYHAMNKAIVRAVGEYCFFLNSGDYLVSSDIFDKIFTHNPMEDVLYGNMYVCLNEKVVEVSVSKGDISFIDLYLSRIKHQASFLKRDLFERYGLYNEQNRIVSDWEFFLKVIGLNNASSRHINEFITYFDNGGISNNLHEIRLNERNRILHDYVPAMILEDYKDYSKLEFLRPALRNKLSLLILKAVVKLSVAGEKLFTGR